MLRRVVTSLALALAACGGQDEGSGPPAAGDERAAAAVAALRARVVRGEALSDDTWSADVQRVAEALWPDAAAGASARRIHASLAHLAGDVGRQLAPAPETRDEIAGLDPTGLAIHDAFVERSAAGAEDYRRWVETHGPGLLERRHEAILGGGR